MFAWGSTIHGELGLGGIEEDFVYVPRLLQWFGTDTVKEAACSLHHTLLLTKEGKVYSCGNNDYGQLGHTQPRKRPHPVSELDAHQITHVACGISHSMALNQWGQVFTWGSDKEGQLGNQQELIQPSPKILKALVGLHIIQIACGEKHSIALTNAGEIYAWGANDYGQLGIGRTSTCEKKPVLVSSLNGVPIALVACGGYHTFALTTSGAIFAWGKNTLGQLGLNDTISKSYPTLVRSLRSIRICYISCGEEFSTFLTLDGGIFTCGAGMYGQLGHGNTSNEAMPRKVSELMGSVITQVICGYRHTLALVPSRGRIYSFGLGSSGQLGISKSTTSAPSPQVVIGPWSSQSGTSLLKSSSEEYTVKRIFAGGDHCFTTVTNKSERVDSYDCRALEPQTKMLVLDYNYFNTFINTQEQDSVDQEFLLYLETVFKSLSSINGSFLLENFDHYYCSSNNHGINLNLAENTFSLIGRFENKTIKDLILACITDDLLTKLHSTPPDVEALRIYVTLPLYHEFNNPRQYLKLHVRYAKAFLTLLKPACKVLSSWLDITSHDYFERIICNFKNVVHFILRNQQLKEGELLKPDENLRTCLDLLALLKKLNNLFKNFQVSYETFYLSELSECADVRVDYYYWRRDFSNNTLYLCNYPFIFDITAKVKILQIDQLLEMRRAVEELVISNLNSIFYGISQEDASLQIIVKRDKIASDALAQLQLVDDRDLKRPLIITFEGEEAQDVGGVKKEFFLLVLRELLDPIYGMFRTYDSSSHLLWFREKFLESRDMYYLIGIICGLAIYNFIIIDLPFPQALYKKILSEKVDFSDLQELTPTVGNSLKHMLEYEDNDFEEIFGIFFEVSYTELGETVNVPLKDNGAETPVTQENKKEFVDLYIDYVFNKAVKEQYEAFSRGFLRVCNGKVLKLFYSHELMAMVTGNENYDWHVLEEVAEYKNGYSSSDVTIRYFWEVIHEMSLEDKKKFLLYLTGSYRIPLGGMREIKIIIQPTNDERFLPVAHTCFNLLDLPRYKTKERLRYKLLQAIQQTEGFSIV